MLLAVVGVGLALALVAGSSWSSGAAAERRAGDDAADAHDADEEAIVSAAHDLIRRGASPARAVEELSRGRGAAVRILVNLDPDVLNDPRFPYFRTRPGRLRIKEIQDILSKKAAVRPAIGSTLAEVLAESIKQGLPAEQAAEALAGRVMPEETAAFAAMSLDDLARSLREVSHRQASLASPRARGVAVAIQDALRSKSTASRGIAVGWLVRAGGPGRRGETMRLGEARSALGRGSACDVRLDGDAAVCEEHAEVVTAGGEFVIAPLAGPVSVEGKPVTSRHTLSDGETIALGAGIFVFKSARSGTAPASDGLPGPVRRAR